MTQDEIVIWRGPGSFFNHFADLDKCPGKSEKQEAHESKQKVKLSFEEIMQGQITRLVVVDTN